MIWGELVRAWVKKHILELRTQKTYPKLEIGHMEWGASNNVYFMSLELISGIKDKISDNVIAEIIKEISCSEYENVYFSKDYCSYGFTRKGSEYIEKTPPLFDLFINESYVSLSVYGDLKELEKIRETVIKSFSRNNVSIELREEGDE